MDAYGHGMAIDLADLSKLTDLKLHEFTQEKFRHMCILSGCDYLPSVKGIGLHKALKLLRKSSSVDKVDALPVESPESSFFKGLFIAMNHSILFFPGDTFPQTRRQDAGPCRL